MKVGWTVEGLKWFFSDHLFGSKDSREKKIKKRDDMIDLADFILMDNWHFSWYWCYRWCWSLTVRKKKCTKGRFVRGIKWCCYTSCYLDRLAFRINMISVVCGMFAARQRGIVFQSRQSIAIKILPRYINFL